MMEESRTKRLHELLRRLGKALHATVVSSDEVRACLEELREDGWQAVHLFSYLPGHSPERDGLTIAQRVAGSSGPEGG